MLPSANLSIFFLSLRKGGMGPCCNRITHVSARECFSPVYVHARHSWALFHWRGRRVDTHQRRRMFQCRPVGMLGGTSACLGLWLRLFHAHWSSSLPWEPFHYQMYFSATTTLLLNGSSDTARRFTVERGSPRRCGARRLDPTVWDLQGRTIPRIGVASLGHRKAPYSHHRSGLAGCLV